MIPTLEALRSDIHTKMKELRNIDNIVTGDVFADFWNQLNDDQKLIVVNYVAWINKTALLVMIKQIRNSKLENMNVPQLRALAKKRGLVAFMQMSKSTLLSELSKLEGLDYDEE